MGTPNVPLVCFCDGKLMDEDRNTKYVGGYTKLGTVSKAIGFVEFKEKIHAVLKLPPNGIEFKIKCGISFDKDTLIAIDVDDDESLKSIFDYPDSKCIRAYIIKQDMPVTNIITPRNQRMSPTNADVHVGGSNFSKDGNDDEYGGIENPSVQEHSNMVFTKGRFTEKTSASKRKVVASTKRDPSAFKHVLSQEDMMSQTKTKPKQRPMHESKHKSNVMPTPSNIELTMPLVDIATNYKAGEIYKNELPIFMRPYVLAIENVNGDGNCGFRVLARLMGFDYEFGWKKVRAELLSYANQNQHRFGFMDEETLQQGFECLSWTDPTVNAPKHKWLKMPYVGFLAASCYKIVIPFISRLESITFIPLFDPPPRDGYDIQGGILLVGEQEDHFVKMEFQQGAPLPPVAMACLKQATEEWILPLEPMIKHFRKLSPQLNQPNDPIVLLNTAEY